MLYVCISSCLQKEKADQVLAEEPTGFKVGKGKIPEDTTEVDSASLRPVIIEPEVRHV